MIPEQFVIVGAILNCIGGISYLIETIKGRVTPNKVTWFLWATAPLIAFAAEIYQGKGLTSLLTFMVGFSPLLVFIASFFNTKSQWHLSRIDIICGILAILGILAWYGTKNPNMAILFSIFADLAAGVPTLIKAYKEPESENSLVFLMGALSAGITLLAIDTWNFAHYAFPLYIFVICTTFVILIKSKIGIPIKNTLE